MLPFFVIISIRLVFYIHEANPFFPDLFSGYDYQVSSGHFRDQSLLLPAAFSEMTRYRLYLPVVLSFPEKRLFGTVF